MSDANHRETYLVSTIIRKFCLPLDSNFLTPDVIAVIALFQIVRIELCNVGSLTQEFNKPFDNRRRKVPAGTSL